MIKPAFGVQDHKGLKKAHSATKTSLDIEILPEAGLHTCIILCREQITKALIRIQGSHTPCFFFFFFFGKIGNFLSGIGKKTYFLALGMGPNFGPKIG